MSRRSHLVGTIPAPGAREAMDDGPGRAGIRASTCFPTARRGSDWTGSGRSSRGCAQNPDVELARDGDWTDYDDSPQFRVKRGHRLEGDSIDLGYARFFRESRPIFQQLVSERGLTDVPFQVGIPSDLDLALFTFGPRRSLRARRAFTDATLREIREIHEEAPGEVVFQIEVPAELIFVARVPGQLQPLMARWMARTITGLARKSPEGTRFGIHLCLGDLNHRSLARMKDTRPVVHLANAIARRWPAGRTLEFMHAPFAAAVEPPRTEERWYRPLERLRLPPSTRFIAGFAHDRQDLDVQLRLRATIDEAVGAPVDIATSCGLGRRDPEAAAAAMHRTAELVAD